VHLRQMAFEGSVALPGMSQLDLLPKLTCDDGNVRKTSEPIGFAVLHSADHQTHETLHAPGSLDILTQQQLLPVVLEAVK